MFILRLIRKSRSTREPKIFHLITSAILVCIFIYAWASTGCVGFYECYLCRTFTPSCFLNANALNNHSAEDDFAKLMDLKNFTFLMNNLACNNSDLLLLVLVFSDPYNYEKRMAVRNTWGRAVENKFKLMFLLGIPNSTVAQERLDDENKAYNDLLQGNFFDTYRNLTYKHVMALKWTKYFCPKVKYLLKSDDDVFVNSPSFLHYLSLNLPEKNLMRCFPIYEGRAQRTSRSKWRVTWSEYKFRKYPPYCQGFAVLYSFDVVLSLYSKAQIANYFWIEDVFITGFLAMSANLTPSSFGKFMLEPHIFQQLLREDSRVFSYLLGPWNLSPVDVLKLWKMADKAGNIVEVINS